MHRNARRVRNGAATLGAVFALALSGCGGVTQFSDTTPITVRGPAPEVPPEPPPAPKPKKKRVEVKQDRIEITEKIMFELNEAVIRPESFGLVDEIVETVRENPQITKLDIIGHTSDEGSEQYNQDLSDRRAKAVMEYLTSHGIAADRLSAQGMGESKPIADNATEEGREQNRRVEFLIVAQPDDKADKKEKKGKKDKKKAEGGAP